MLDCTLRDGGYCNDCRFGLENEKKIIGSLMHAGIDIIECGFLMNTVSYDPDRTRFTKVEQISSILPSNREGKMFVALTDYGKYNPEELPWYDGGSIDGLRVAFHKKDIDKAIQECELIQKKGYKVFVQAMVSVCYTDTEFLDLIQKINHLKPYVFYIVDSFGSMKPKQLKKLFLLTEANLDQDIQIGFHSHNNLQMAFSNAQALSEFQTNRDLVIDSSIYGMGRGAGNLNTELFVQYLNDTEKGSYQLKPLLNVIDEVINEFYERNHWGYSLPNYLSAVHNAHPNYALYLDNKKTLTVKDMNEIFDRMDHQKKFSYDKAYIEELYLNYMAKEGKQRQHKVDLEKELQHRKILLIAPGRSATDQRELVTTYARENDVLPISVNFDYPYIPVKYIFISNLRRFRNLNPSLKGKCIATSNIQDDSVYLQVNYKDLLSEEEAVRDNAGLMAIRFLLNCHVEEIILVGFDGYTHDEDLNYASSQLAFASKNTVLDSINEGMKKVLEDYSRKVNLIFLTEPVWGKLNRT